MQLVSQAYKKEMLQYIRDESYVWVYLGIISHEAQNNAAIEQDLYDISSKNIFSGQTFESYYATFEQNQCHVDGSMTLVPETLEANPLFQGAVTEDLVGSITFTFGEFLALSWRGLTIDFGEFYPTSFMVTNGHQTYTHTNDSEKCLLPDDIFTNTSYLTITANTMVGGQQRLRILSMTFGVGLVFDNSTLISTSRKNTVDHLSSKLPTKSFTWTVDNRSHRFHVDDPTSFINFLELEQDVEYEYGRKIVADDGTSSIYRLDGGRVKLKTWSSNQTTAKFSAVGSMDYLDGEYYKGEYHPEGITAYDAVMDILTDAGITEYRIDEYLKKVILKNPVPKDSYKNCLQLIANRCRSVMYEDRQGRVVIDSSFMPDITSLTVSDEASWSNRMKVLSDDDLINYATFEQDFTTVDDTMLLLPDIAVQQDNNGFVSELVFPRVNDNLHRRLSERMGNQYFPFRSSSEVGVAAAQSVSITVEWESQWTFYCTEFEFGGTYPTKVRLHLFAGNTELSAKEYDIEGLTWSIEDNFYEIDKMVIEFTEAKSNQRIHLQKLRFTRLTDYRLRFIDMDQKPTVTAVDRVKTIDVHYYQFSDGEEEENVSTSFLPAGDSLLTFDEPHYAWRVEYTHKEEEDPEGGDPIDVTPTGNLSIVESGAYYVIVRSSIDADVDVNAYQYAISDNTYSYANGESGTVRTLSNDLLDNAEDALTLAEWLGDYFNYDASYSITYRGEPRIDCDDIIYIDSDYTQDTLIRVEEEQLDTATGMSLKCKIKGKRVDYRGK